MNDLLEFLGRMRTNISQRRDHTPAMEALDAILAAGVDVVGAIDAERKAERNAADAADAKAETDLKAHADAVDAKTVKTRQ